MLNRSHALWLFILLLSGLLQWLELVPAWRFDRSQIDNGALWLLFSGHLVHLNWTHWALNMAGLALVAFFFTGYGSLNRWLLVLFTAALFVGAGLYWFNPDTWHYVGLSGVLHGLFVYGAIREISRYPVSGSVLLLLLAGKLCWELFYGALPGSEQLTSGRVVTDAHLYGAIGGVVAVTLLYLLDQLVQVEDRQQDTEHDH